MSKWIFLFVTAKSYEVTLTLDQQYTAALDDPSSETYIKLKRDIETAVSISVAATFVVC